MIVTFQVTEEDIRVGKRWSFCECPVALALKRVYNKDFLVKAMGVSIDGTTYCFDWDIYEFIKIFDRGGSVIPFTATVVLP